MTEILVSRVHYPVTVLGPGRRLGIWLQGCPLACRGCMSRDTWDPDAGTPVPVERLVELWHEAERAGADGLTVSGGEPLTQAESLAQLLTAARTPGADADFLLYTGFEPGELDQAQRHALNLADAVITGRYDITRPTRLIWRGSANQKLVPQTDRGVRVYTPYLDFVPDQAPMQVRVDDNAVWLVGVPPAGALARWERAMRANGISFGGFAWRP